MGQRDPLTEWQREGFEMFGQMMQGIAQDLLRYVMHVQVEVSEPAKAQAAAAAAAVAEAEAKAKEEAEALGDAPKVALDWNAPTAEPANEADAEDVTEAEDAAEDAAAEEPKAEAEAESDEAQAEEEPQADDEPEAEAETSLVTIGGSDAEVQILGYSMPDDPSSGGGMSAAAKASDGEGPAADAPEAMAPVVKSEWDKTARNAPCPCGSGKKYKRCHGSDAA
jgi:preprotein translocase subunit SecA